MCPDIAGIITRCRVLERRAPLPRPQAVGLDRLGSLTRESVPRTVHDETMKLLLAGLDRPVIQNAVRSMYVEYQVAVLLGEEWQLVGTDWGGWDFQSRTVTGSN